MLVTSPEDIQFQLPYTVYFEKWMVTCSSKCSSFKNFGKAFKRNKTCLKTAWDIDDPWDLWTIIKEIKLPSILTNVFGIMQDKREWIQENPLHCCFKQWYVFEHFLNKLFDNQSYHSYIWPNPYNYHLYFYRFKRMFHCVREFSGSRKKHRNPEYLRCDWLE